MQKVGKKHYGKFIDFARVNTCNTVYPMSIAEKVGFEVMAEHAYYKVG